MPQLGLGDPPSTTRPRPSAWPGALALLWLTACGGPEAEGEGRAGVGQEKAWVGHHARDRVAAGGRPPAAAIGADVLPAHLRAAAGELALWHGLAEQHAAALCGDEILAAAAEAVARLRDIFPDASEGGAGPGPAAEWRPGDPERRLLALGMSSVERARRLAAAASLAVDAPAAHRACEASLAALDRIGGALDGALPARPRDPYTFSQSWFADAGRHWRDHTREWRGRPVAILEVGSFEGASTTWMLDELMDHPRARLTAVDTFGGGMEHRAGASDPYRLSTLEQRFDANVGLSPHAHQLEKMKMTSREAGLKLGDAKASFDFIYIDGSHTAFDVLQDAVLLWPLLAEGGTMAFDDYHWHGYDEPHLCPKLAIDAFLDCLGPEVTAYEISDYQKWVVKKIVS